MAGVTNISCVVEITEMVRDLSGVIDVALIGY
jgi:hypothetical protein